jgi:glycosyltransferase 2 family protein
VGDRVELPGRPRATRRVDAPELLRQGLKLFAAPKGQPRARRGTDVVLLVSALLGAAAVIAAYPPGAFERSLERFVATVPDWLDPVWGFLADSLWLWAAVLVVASLVRRRFAVVAVALGSCALAALAALLAARLALDAWPDVADSVLGTSEGARFPHVRSAAAVAVILVISPHLVSPLRKLSNWVVLLGTLGVVLVAGGTPSGTLGAFLIAVAAAAAFRLVLGTSIGRPGLEDVQAALAELGVHASELEQAERRVAGVFHVRGVDTDGRPLLVKLYGRDAYDTQLLARLWRRLWYRGSGRAIPRGRLESAEHEAFVTLLARNAGLATREVVTAGATLGDDALLVLRGGAEPLATLAPERLDDELLAGAWRALELLDELRIAHQQIDPETVALVSGEVGLVELGEATVAPDAHGLAADRAQLLMTGACLVGGERALAAAVRALGADGVEALLPYLQSAAFSPSLRRALKAAEIDVDDFRAQAAATIEAEAPELVKLRRVSWRAALQIALLSLASYAIVSAATDVDWGEIRSTVAEASWAWIVVAFLAAQLPRLTQALSTLGSAPTSLPFGPVYAMQLATGYMNVALPSNLARMAVNIRFFQRQGLSAPVAVTSGTIDSFASTVVQAALLGVLLLFSESSLALELPFPSGGSRTLLWIVVGLVVASAVVLVAVRRLRDAIVVNVRRWWPEVRSAVAGLRASSKLALLVLGSLATEVLFAVALGLFARSLGYEISLAELLVINMSVSLLGSLVPVPGNIGVAEFGLTIGLVSAGMADGAALAAVLLYRIATYYLPPLWGFFAMLWLQRNRYL